MVRALKSKVLSNPMQKRTITFVAVAAFLALLGHSAYSQYSPIPPSSPLPSPYQPPQSYSNYYNQHVQNYYRPPVNVRDYTIDKYYARNPNLSPYLNLARRGSGDSLNNYYRYVRPEVQRRSAAASNVNKPSPQFNSNPYFNQIYKPGTR